MRPQFDHVADIYRGLVEANLYLMPEGLVTHCSHSAMGLFGGDIYAGEMEAFSYDSHIPLAAHEEDNSSGPTVDQRTLAGEQPIDVLFRALAHRRVPLLHLHRLPWEQWDASAFEALKRLFAAYREVRDRMVQREVLPDTMGVRWRPGTGGGVGDDGRRCLVFTFRALECDGVARDIMGQTQAEGRLKAYGLYQTAAADRLQPLDERDELATASSSRTSPEPAP